MSELRLAFRSLAKSPGFTTVALLTLALGIGLNAAMFNIVNSLALQPLHFPDADRLFRFERVTGAQRTEGHRPAHFIEIARDSAEVAQVASARPWTFTLAEPGNPAETLNSLRASAGYFSVLGLKMERGREFRPEEDRPGQNRVIILSHKFWQARFGANPDIIGQTVRLDGEPHQIVGVAPRTAADPRTVGTPEIYRPLALTSDEIADPVDHAYRIIGRLKPGVTLAQAEVRFAALAATLAKTDPAEYSGAALEAAPLQPPLQGTGRQLVLMLIGLSGFVLLIACANLANLLLARAIAQAREFAIRGALGASRAQLIRPLAAQCALLAVGGGALGLIVCLWTNDWMSRKFAASGSEIVFVLDWRLLLFALGASLLTALFFGVAPAWLVSRVQIGDALKSSSRGTTTSRTHRRFRQALIAGQFALALILLSGAVLFVRGFNQLLRREAGWQPASVVRGILSLPSTRYPDPARMMQFYERVQDRVATVPGVASAAVSYEVPAFGFPSGHGFLIEGQPPPAPNHAPGAPVNGVTPSYFATVGTRLIRGRDFTRQDRADTPPVIILNETMARALFPAGDAIGRRVAYVDNKEPVWTEIVGIAQDVTFLDWGNRSRPFQAYIPLAQATWSYVALSVRTQGPASAMLDPIRRAVSEVDPDMAIKELMPVSAFIQRNVQDVQAINQLLIGFALLGLFLAALGIYGVIARLVAQRTTEIGIRMALGAQLGEVVRLMVGAGMRLVLVGAGIGILGAVALARFLVSIMPGIATGSAVAIAAAALALFAVALLACWLPARRAARINPIEALRAE